MELGVCLIGAGDIGNVHAQAWEQVSGARLLCIADPQADRAQALAEKSGVEYWFTDYHSALQLEGVTAVSVAVPTATHRECTEAALAHGHHVLCEKPVALCVEDALAMQAAADAAGRKLAIGFCKRFSGQVQTMREIIQSGALGRPVMYRHMSGVEIRFKPWIMDRRMGGGPLFDMACHYFDQWRVIFGSDPVRVKASGLTFSEGAPELPGVEPQVDTFTAIVDYASGDSGVFSLSWGLPRGVRTESLEDCLGPQGLLKIKPNQVLKVSGGGQEEVFDSAYMDMYAAQARAFAEAIATDGPVAATVSDGLWALNVSLAALESIQTGTTVEVPRPEI